MVESIIYEGKKVNYEYREAEDKQICLATKNPKDYCNGFYAFSSKDPGNGSAFVVIPVKYATTGG